MALSLYDTMAREKRPFVPKDPNRVTMYVCGPTVYSYAHIGNARPPVAFDVLFRLLRAKYGAEHVVYAANITPDTETGIGEDSDEALVSLLRTGQAACTLLPTRAQWFGVTHALDKPAVVARLQGLIGDGTYPAPLWPCHTEEPCP